MLRGMDALDLRRRARVHAALGEPTRLEIVDLLSGSDRSVTELADRCGLAGNLLAHHLDVLEAAGVVERVVSAGDRRRRYVRLRPGAPSPDAAFRVPAGSRVLFVCTHNSARSQLAAALWERRTGRRARSAGTHPASRVHPGAVAAARRAGLDLAGARPRSLTDRDVTGSLIVTVCDLAHEELEPEPSWLHWSVPDPVSEGTRRAFDRALDEIRGRIEKVTLPAPHARSEPR